MDNILEINQLSKEYPSFLLDNIKMEIPYGKVIGLIGENGAGKTTLISLILNQIKRDHGEIKIFGLDNITDEITIKKDLGFVIDECCFHACLNPININSIMKSVYSQWDEKQYFKFLLDFSINHKKKVEEMSKGMKSKLMLAVALSHNPRLLILDEITSGLDPVIREEILLILKKFVNDGTKSVFFSTHITSDLDKIADYVVFFHQGVLIFMESLEKLRQEFYLIEYTEEPYEKINYLDIVAKYVEENKYRILVRNNKNSDYSKIGKVPTIDDIMLLNIKGRIAK